MPEYSSTTITPADGVQVPSMNGSTSGNFLLSALRDYILASKGRANGLASLGSDGKLTASQLPDLADDVIVVASYAVLPATGTAGKIYITADNNKMYRWDSDLSTPDYVELSVDLSEYAKLTDLAAEETARETADTNLNDALTAIDHRVENLEQAKGKYVVSTYKDGSITPSGKGNWAVVEGLRGVSRVENGQLVPTLHAGSINNGITPSYNASTQTMGLSGTSTGTFDAILIDASPILTPGHTYIVALEKSATGFTFTDNYQALSNTASYVFTAGAGNPYFNIRARGNAGVTLNYEGRIGLTDLNIYFGTSDLSFLGATDSAKLATIQTNYPWLLLPSEYGVRIVDSSYSGVRAWARNVWDEDVEVIGSNLWSKNYIPAIPNTVYYAETPSAITVRFYDVNKTQISFQPSIIQSTFTTPSGCYYMKFSVASGYGTTYQHNICINQSDSQNGTYTPYHAPDTLSLTFQGKSAGSVYDQLETNAEIVQEINGQKVTIYKKRTTQRTDSYTFDGTESWSRNETFGFFYTFVLSAMIKPTQDKDAVANIICSKYTADTPKNVQYGTNNKTISVGLTGWIGNGVIGVYDSTYNDATTFASAMAGMTINYEKATPVVTLSDPIIDNTLLTESGGRMATVQTGTVVDGSFDMGFITL